MAQVGAHVGGGDASEEEVIRKALAALRAQRNTVGSVGAAG
ncbi:MAG: hypothetical protein V2A73_13970 [Pseudomonadota bacterium]